LIKYNQGEKETLKVKLYKKGEKKATVEEELGASLTKSTGEWAIKKRKIDRENNYYDETVTAPDGRVMHECHEPLGSHIGHGSAKKKRRVHEGQDYGF